MSSSKPLRESQQTVLLCRELEQHGAMVLPIVGGSFQPPGWPDRYVHTRNGAWWLEFKGPQTRLGVAQRERIVQLNRRQPGCAYVVRFCDRTSWSRGTIEDHDGRELDVWRDATELLDSLYILTQEARR